MLVNGKPLQKGSFFLYRSASSNLLTWGEVLEVGDERHLLCRIFSKKFPEGETGVLPTGVLHGVIPKNAFQLAEKEHWPTDSDPVEWKRFAVEAWKAGLN